MTLAGVKKELRELKKTHASGFKTIEELLNTRDISKLTDDELIRIIQYYEPGLTREDIEAELDNMAAEEAKL